MSQNGPGRGDIHQPEKRAESRPTLFQQTVGGTQFNTFKIQELEQEDEHRSDVEIEEAIEDDDNQSTQSRCGAPCSTPPEAVLCGPHESRKTPVRDLSPIHATESLDTQRKHWVTTQLPKPGPSAEARDVLAEESIEDESVSSEEEKVPHSQAHNHKVVDTVNAPHLLRKLDENFRPFTPPFAQLHNVAKKPQAPAAPAPAPARSSKVPHNGILNVDESHKHVALIYDPVLKCYYDPKVHAYYELKP